MKKTTLLLPFFLLFNLSAVLIADPGEARDVSSEEIQPPMTVDDPRIEKLLEELDGISPHEAPSLPLRMDDNYANTASDVEPFSGVTPYKEHFLEQMEGALP